MGSEAMDVCRLCACRLEEGRGEWIFAKERHNRGGNNKGQSIQPLGSIIRRYLRMEVHENDDLPQKVCPECCSILDAFHKFAEQCMQIQDKIVSGQVSLIVNDTHQDDTEEDSEVAEEEGHHSDEVEEADDFCMQNNLELEWGNSNIESTTSRNKKAASPHDAKEIGIRRRSRKQSMPVKAVMIVDDSSEGRRSAKKRRMERRRAVGKVKATLKVSCLVCGEEHAKWSTLTQHYRVFHGTQTVEGKCTCGETLTKTDQMSYHRRKHLMMYSCDKCNKSFCNKSDLEGHKGTHLPKDEQPFQCSQCQKRFHAEALLKRHEKTHVPVEKRAIWQCDVCNKKMCSKNTLLTHQRIVHMGERAYVCDVCGRTFTMKGNLKDHMSTHSNETRFNCEKCGKGFKSKSGMKIHMEVHNEDPLVCTVCGMHLKTSRTLERHMVIHSDETPYLCKYCGKGFKRYKTLKEHYEFHEGKKTYHCKFCGRNFNNASNRRTHQRRMHLEELHREGRPPMKKAQGFLSGRSSQDNGLGNTPDLSGSDTHKPFSGISESCRDDDSGKQGIMQVMSDHASWHQSNYVSTCDAYVTAGVSHEKSSHHDYMRL